VKGPSEEQVNDALRRLGWVVIKLPDDTRWQKPCDTLAWQAPMRNVWLEVKQEPGLTWNISDLRPSQRQGVYLAQRVGVPYLLVIRWLAHGKRPTWWTALELTDPGRMGLWTTSLALTGTSWMAQGASALACLSGIQLERHGFSIAGQSPYPSLRPGAGGDDPGPDAGGGIRPVRTGPVTAR
jgi:hypothetical protein